MIVAAVPVVFCTADTGAVVVVVVVGGIAGVAAGIRTPPTMLSLSAQV